MKQLFPKKWQFVLLPIIAVNLYACSGNGSKEASDSSVTATDSSTVSLDTVQTDDSEQIRICTEMLPPAKPSAPLVTTTDTAILPRGKGKNDTLISNKIVRYKQMAPMKSIFWTPYKWTYTTLNVMFLDGDPAVQKKVRDTAKEWEKHCGIHFNFGTFASADITISFKYQGSWSYVGNYSAQNSPSMNFGWLNKNTDQDEYDRVVLHEFGHAIGFLHEHSNTNGKLIQWDKPKVYAYYAKPPNNWNEDDVNNNIFIKYNNNEINASVFDPKSIMLYAFPASLTLNNVGTESNSKLSDMDKAYAAKMYPLGI